MNKFSVLTCACALVLSTSVSAIEIPINSHDDARIQYVDFKDNDVVRVNCANGFMTTIVFSPDEEITDYGSGFSSAWEFASSHNFFFLKPKDRDGTTNLVIVTNKHVYNLDVHLVLNPKDATYRLTFTYNKETAKLKQAQKKQEEIQRVLNEKDPECYQLYPHGGNWNYTENFGKTENSKMIAPVEVHDNGRFTYFKFRNNQDFPAIYRVTSDGEAMVNSHIENGVLVVHGVYQEYRIRAGKDVVGVYNEGYQETYNENVNVEPVTPTSVPTIERRIK